MQSDEQHQRRDDDDSDDDRQLYDHVRAFDWPTANDEVNDVQLYAAAAACERTAEIG